eukprot:scaffold118463_cov63-Phaeocystis_antarctica.AAC.1
MPTAAPVAAPVPLAAPVVAAPLALAALAFFWRLATSLRAACVPQVQQVRSYTRDGCYGQQVYGAHQWSTSRLPSGWPA